MNKTYEEGINIIENNIDSFKKDKLTKKYEKALYKQIAVIPKNSGSVRPVQVMMLITEIPRYVR